MNIYFGERVSYAILDTASASKLGKGEEESEEEKESREIKNRWKGERRDVKRTEREQRNGEERSEEEKERREIRKRWKGESCVRERCEEEREEQRNR